MQKTKNFIDILAFIEANKDFSADDFIIAYKVKSCAKNEISPEQFEKICLEISSAFSDSYSVTSIEELVKKTLYKYNV